MIGGAMGRLRERFRDQFTPVERGWVYRRAGRGPALPVGDEDQAMLVAGFDRAIKWMAWGGFLGAMLMWGLLDWFDVEIGYWTAALPYMLVWSAVAWHVWNAPHRLLDGRAPVAPGLSGGEVRREGLRKLPWTALILGVVVSIGIAVRIQFEPDPWAPHNRHYYVWSTLFLTFFLAMAWAKRRAGSGRG